MRGPCPSQPYQKEWSCVMLDCWMQLARFFRVAGRATRLYGGCAAKRWFRECKAEHQALRDAVRRGDTDAAQAARRVFTF